MPRPGPFQHRSPVVCSQEEEEEAEGRQRRRDAAEDGGATVVGEQLQREDRVKVLVSSVTVARLRSSVSSPHRRRTLDSACARQAKQTCRGEERRQRRQTRPTSSECVNSTTREHKQTSKPTNETGLHMLQTDNQLSMFGCFIILADSSLQDRVHDG